MRQSKRLAGIDADCVQIKDDNDRATYSDYDGGLEDILAGNAEPSKTVTGYDRCTAVTVLNNISALLCRCSFPAQPTVGVVLGLLTYAPAAPADDNSIEDLPAEKQEQFQEIRCSSAAGRGSVYDSVAGEEDDSCTSPWAFIAGAVCVIWHQQPKLCSPSIIPCSACRQLQSTALQTPWVEQVSSNCLLQWSASEHWKAASDI